MCIEENTNLLIEAARKGDTPEVQRLIPLSDPTCNDSQALVCAASGGHTQCVRLLIPVSVLKSPALNLAAGKGYTQCVKLLLPAYDLKAKSSALFWATANGHTDCVKLLILASDPKVDNSFALQKAVANAHQSCIDLLYPVSDPSAALHQLQHDYPDDVSIWGELEQRIAHEQNQKLVGGIDKTTRLKSVRKM